MVPWFQKGLLVSCFAGGPILVPVSDASQVKLQGDLARIVPVGRPVTVGINTQLAGDAQPTASVTCEFTDF